MRLGERKFVPGGYQSTHKHSLLKPKTHRIVRERKIREIVCYGFDNHLAASQVGLSSINIKAKGI